MKVLLSRIISTALLLLSVSLAESKETTNATVSDNSLDKSSITSTASSMDVKNLVSGIDFKNIDKSVRPQDDFYSYVNGGWLKSHVIPADKTAIGSFYMLRDQADEDVKQIIENVSATNNLAGSDEQKVGDLFASYMDLQQRNKLGLAPLRSELAKITRITSKNGLASYFATGQIIGVSNPLAFYVTVDAKKSSSYAAYLWQSGLGLPDRDYYFKKDERSQKIREAYLQHIEKMFDLAGFKGGNKAAKMIMDLETQLAGFHRDRRENRNSEKRYNKYRVVDLVKLTDKFNWSVYLKAQGVEKQQDIIINQPEFIRGFGGIFGKTSLANWKIYLKWNLLNSYASYLNEDLEKQNFEFYSKMLNGRKAQRPLWKKGVNLVNSALGEVIGKVYVKRHFTKNAKVRMTQLVENLRSAYGDSIEALNWMSATTKAAAKKKLAAFKPKIGYPDKWQDYSAVEIKRDALIANIMSARHDSHNKDIEKLAGPVRKWEWGMTPQTVNAYYSPTRNEIVFPAAILQPPFFNLVADDAVNYGSIGAVIGHEMGHGFDDQGSRYDGSGNLSNWWSKADLAEFKKRTAKLVAQYSNYKVFTDLNIDGKLTLGENIGDLSGVTIAYRAYKKSLHGKEAPVIDGLTGEQRFFMGYAQIWRSKSTEKALRNRIATNTHSPGKFRALGSLSNMPEFYQAFNLKPGDAMYIKPENRVKIW